MTGSEPAWGWSGRTCRTPRRACITIMCRRSASALPMPGSTGSGFRRAEAGARPGRSRRFRPPASSSCRWAGWPKRLAALSHRREGSLCAREVDCRPALETRVDLEQKPRSTVRALSRSGPVRVGPGLTLPLGRLSAPCGVGDVAEHHGLCAADGLIPDVDVHAQVGAVTDRERFDGGRSRLSSDGSRPAHHGGAIERPEQIVRGLQVVPDVEHSMPAALPTVPGGRPGSRAG